MINISLFNQKGGVGKSTSLVNIAATFSKMNKKVLVVDCDYQKTASDYLLTYVDTDKSINDYFIGADINTCLVDVITIKSISKKELIPTNITVLPSCKNIETLEMNSVYEIKELLEKIKGKYDYCFFDLPAHLSGISLCALVASDYVIVPANADTDSLKGYNDLIDTINQIKSNGWNTSLSVLGILYNDVNTVISYQKYILKQTQSNMRNLIFPTIIKSRSKIGTARFFGVPFPYSNLDKKLENDYESIAKEIEKRIRKWQK